MSKKETDILLIRKYLNGELDARAMHQLEKRAQEDSFLMDALEGYENTGGDQQPQLDELGERLRRRVNQREKRIIPWRFLSIAASVLIVASIGGILFFNNQPVNKLKVARVVVPAKAHGIDTDTIGSKKQDELAALKPEEPAERLHKVANSEKRKPTQYSVPASADELVAEAKVRNDTAIRDTTRLKEVIVTGYAVQRRKDVTGAVAIVSSKDLSITQPDSINRLLQGRAAGVAITGTGNSKIRLRGRSKSSINGRVIGKDDGLPIVGATVKIAGTNKGAVTDINGKFSINADSSKTDKLVIANIGYKSREVIARSRDSLKSIALEPANSSLNEVVVTGYTSQRRDVDDNPLVIDSRPVNGWSDFRKYMKENAISPDGKEGVVKLSFMVDRLGNLSDIKVVKSVSPATDQKAIDLLNDGPRWLGSTSGNPEKVTVRIRFGK